MKLLKFIFTIALLYMAMLVTAQTRVVPPNRNSATVNQYDAKGQPQGMWVISQAARMGEGASMEFGRYEHGEKYGPWYKLDDEGELVSMETYRGNVLDGEAKYFEKGRMIATGTYRGLNPEREFDTIVVADPITGLESLRAIHNDRNTVRHGIWRFYNSDNGRLDREEEYQVDSLIFTRAFGMTAADSAAYKQHEQGMPHIKKIKKKVPASKSTE